MNAKLFLVLVAIFLLVIPSALSIIPTKCATGANYNHCLGVGGLPDYSTILECYTLLGYNQDIELTTLGQVCKDMIKCVAKTRIDSDDPNDCPVPAQPPEIDCSTQIRIAGQNCETARSIITNNPYVGDPCEQDVWTAALSKNSGCEQEVALSQQQSDVDICNTQESISFLAELNRFISATNGKMTSVEGVECMTETNYNNIRSVVNSFTSPIWNKNTRQQICRTCQDSCGTISSTYFRTSYTSSPLKCPEFDLEVEVASLGNIPPIITLSFNNIQSSLDSCTTQSECAQAYESYETHKNDFTKYGLGEIRLDPAKLKMVRCYFNPNRDECIDCGTTAGTCRFNGKCIHDSNIRPAVGTCTCIGTNMVGNPYVFDSSSSSCEASIVPKINLGFGNLLAPQITAGLCRLKKSGGRI